MTRGILIVGNESSLFNAVAAEAVKRVQSFATAIIPSRFGAGDIESSGTESADLRSVDPRSVDPRSADLKDGAVQLSWNPASAISARTLVLAAENRLKKINDAILVCSPPAVFKTPEALTPREIEILVDDHIKGWFFLIRELILYFRNAGSGLLALVAPDIDTEAEAGKKNTAARNIQLDLLGPSAAASFRNYSQAVIASSANEPYSVMGFTDSEAGSEEEFAAWFFKIVDEASPKNSGRWHKHSKRGFLGRLK